MQYRTYRERIEDLTDRDPRHVEAWMRITYGTLDHLTAAEFESEVLLAVNCIAVSGDEESEQLARSYGL